MATPESALVELDAVELLVIVDNELDPISPCQNPHVQAFGTLGDVIPRLDFCGDERGEKVREVKMTDVCCGAHGLSVMVTGIKDGVRRSLLFDAGPEEDVWERNAHRLKADIGAIELMMLSHWHRDHSGGMPRAIKLINAAKTSNSVSANPVTVDLHPSRPDYRGIIAGPTGQVVLSLEADPSFTELTDAGGVTSLNATAHTVLDGMFCVSGEIPRVTSYELGIRGGARFDAATKEWSRDEKILDERYLVCRIKDKGLVVITGCAHAGAINTALDATLRAPDVPLHCLMGGFHLADADATKLTATVDALKEMKPTALIPGHCSGWRAKFEIERQMPGVLVPSGVGMRYTL